MKVAAENGVVVGQAGAPVVPPVVVETQAVPPVIPTAPAAVAAVPAASKEPKSVVVKEDDEIPEDAELITLPRKALAKRLDSHSKSELKKRFGTSDFAEIEAKLAKVTEYEAREEEARRAALSAEEKLKEDAASAQRERDEWKSKYESAQAEREFVEESGRIGKIAGKSIDEGMVRFALSEFAAHVRGLDAKEIEALEQDEAVVEWFTAYAKKNPRFAREDPKPTVEVRKPITNGVDSKNKPVAKAPASEVGSGGKTLKPGQPNSMSAFEARAMLAAKGLRY